MWTTRLYIYIFIYWNILLAILVFALSFSYYENKDVPLSFISFAIGAYSLAGIYFFTSASPTLSPWFTALCNSSSVILLANVYLTLTIQYSSIHLLNCYLQCIEYVIQCMWLQYLVYSSMILPITSLSTFIYHLEFKMPLLLTF